MVVMAALWNRAGHYIFALWFLSSSFFPRLISAVRDWMSTILPHMVTWWCGLSANLECMSEMCCTRLAQNTGRKKSAFDIIIQLCRVVSSQPRHISTIGKNSNTSSTRPHNMVNFGPLTAEICWRVWGTAGNFIGFWVLAALLQGMSSGRQQVSGVKHRAPPTFGREAITWALAHIPSLFLLHQWTVLPLQCHILNTRSEWKTHQSA